MMHRFTLLAGVALVCAPADSAPKPAAIPICYGGVCLERLHWARLSEGAYSLPSIAGVLEDHSTATLSSDPVFNPIDRKERKEWEVIHGKRDQ